MSGIEIIILIIAIVLIAGGVGYFLTKGQPSLKEFYEENKEEQEQIQSYQKEIEETLELSQELFDKDLRSIVLKKTPSVKTTESQDKSKRKYYPKKKK
jgi:flagellar basal body-associated protein FliL